jgi:hypothetical protein
VRTREESLNTYDALLSSGKLDAHGRWIVTLKRLRVEHSVSILDAERLALADPALRRWVERQINSEQECRKQALAHIRYNGENSLIERLGESFQFRIK